MHQALLQVRQAVPFLNDVPDAIYCNLDHREWHLPSGAIANARMQLEQRLDAYVMTYHRGVFLKDIPAEKHLCAHVAGADLSEEQKKVLQRYEEQFETKGVSFVVYKKPVTIIPVEQSFFYQHISL